MKCVKKLNEREKTVLQSNIMLRRWQAEHSHSKNIKFVRQQHASIAPSKDGISLCFNDSFSQQSAEFRNSIRNIHIQIIIILKLFHVREKSLETMNVTF